MAPTPEEIEAQQRLQDSLARLEQSAATEAAPALQTPDTLTPDTTTAIPDSVLAARLSTVYGPFSAAAQGQEQLEVLENDLFKVTFTNKGGQIKEVELKGYYKIIEGAYKEENTKVPLKLLEDEKNRFEYLIPVAGLSGGVKTSDLYFQARKTDQGVVFRANAGDGRYIEQEYTFSPKEYHIDYEVRMVGMNNIIPAADKRIRLNWLNYLDKLERNTRYERQYSNLYYKPLSDDVDYLSWTSSDEKDLEGVALKWVSNSNQFFNSTLIARENFPGGELSVLVMEDPSEDLKKYQSDLFIPFSHSGEESFAMEFYIGPNEFSRLRSTGYDLEEVIPFGWSIFGTINRWVIRPIFNFLSTFFGNKGIVILMLTLIVKLLLFPLTYRMLYSQSKMGALKPRLENLKEKFKNDPQQQQMEQMKIYREFGVNPLGGCLPVVLQMPIWFALYRFFPASIEFRQAPFLWADDLSSYDVFFQLPFEIPLGFGSHISLFTLLWAVTTLIYTYYNSRHMDMSSQPAMKYMQYLMPLFFLGFFNSFASGLTAYLLFSNLINIIQTVVTKNYIIDQEKLQHELEEYRKKPKKKGSFQERLESALKEQQRIQQERDKNKKVKKK